jgi:hypothetical protein
MYIISYNYFIIYFYLYQLLFIIIIISYYISLEQLHSTTRH